MKTDLSNFYFGNLLNVINTLPKWVLEALFVEIAMQLQDHYDVRKLLENSRTDMIQLYIPEIADYGLMILDRASKKNLPEGIDKNLILYLQAVRQRKNIIDICITNHWTLEQCSMITYKCIKRNFIKHTVTPSLYNTLLFIAGYLKIGEFLIRKNKIDSNTLEYALNLQQQLSSSFGERSKIVEILINMNKVKQEDVHDYLNLKDASKTHFKIQTPVTPKAVHFEKLASQQQETIESLTIQQNKCNEEMIKLSRKAEELKDQLQMQIERNNLLQAKVNEYESKLGIFKKL